MEQESFADLEKVRLEIIEEKVKSAINEFEDNPKQQSAQIEFSKPVLEDILKLVEQRYKYCSK